MTKFFARPLFLGLFFSLFLAACSNVAEDYQLEAQATLAGNEHLVAWDVNLLAGSLVEGDLNITAVRVKIDNTIQGDLTVAASRLEIGEQALIEGDLIYCLARDGRFEQTASARILGEVRNNCQATDRPLELDPPWILQLFGNLVTMILAGFLAALGSIFLPQALNRVQLRAYKHGFAAFGIGLLTWLILIGLSNLWRLSLVALIPVIFLPFLIIAWLVMLPLSLLGALAVAVPCGTWILRLVRIRKTAPIITAMTGAMTLTFGVMFFRLIDLGWISLLLAAGIFAWGLGAALITRGGRR